VLMHGDRRGLEHGPSWRASGQDRHIRCLVFTNDEGKIGGGALARNSNLPKFLQTANAVLIT
jgi:hypothetical protein